jgi:hypothetical protein
VHEATFASNSQLLRRYFPALSPEEELALPARQDERSIDSAVLQRLTTIASEVLTAHRIDPALVEETLRHLTERETSQ